MGARRSTGRPVWRLPGAVLAVVLTAGALVVPALAQEPSCPPNSRAPRCTGSEPGGGNDPSPPPRGSDPSEPPPGQADRSPTPTTPPGQVPDGGTSVSPPVETPSAQVPPPPDLGALRIVSTRLLAAGSDAARLEVLVDEDRARGVDGGWTVTVGVSDGVVGTPSAALGTEAVPAGFPRAGRTVGAFDLATLFTVVGQRSEQRYGGAYLGDVDLRSLGATGQRPTVTVTLFQ